MQDYAIFVDKIKTYIGQKQSLQEAADQAVAECIREGEKKIWEIWENGNTETIDTKEALDKTILVDKYLIFLYNKNSHNT